MTFEALAALAPRPQAPETPAAGASPTSAPPSSRSEEVAAAAEQFEALVLTQLVQVMRRSVGESGLFGSGPGTHMYAHLFDQNFASAIAEAGGIGMRDVLCRSMLGPRAYAEAQRHARDSGIGSAAPFTAREVGALMAERPPSGAPLSGLTGRLQAAARVMTPRGVEAAWGVAGRLTTRELGAQFESQGPDGVARFNVEDAAGYQHCYKCNLFAFEMVRRAGFRVPLVGRTRGWGYLGPDGVMADAGTRTRTLRGNWGRAVTGERAESVDSAIVRGERAFLLAGSATSGRAGHMGVVERVHQIDYDPHGRIERIVYDGWEARAQGAMHLRRRTWNRYGNPGGEDARNGFSRIEIIELRRAGAEGGLIPLHEHAAPSVRDRARGDVATSPAEALAAPAEALAAPAGAVFPQVGRAPYR